LTVERGGGGLLFLFLRFWQISKITSADSWAPWPKRLASIQQLTKRGVACPVCLCGGMEGWSGGGFLDQPYTASDTSPKVLLCNKPAVVLRHYKLTLHRAEVKQIPSMTVAAWACGGSSKQEVVCLSCRVHPARTHIVKVGGQSTMASPGSSTQRMRRSISSSAPQPTCRTGPNTGC